MAVVESESFTDAAELLRVSQPALSVAIKNLEKDLGSQLIIRGGNFFQITEAGQLVYDYGVRMRLDLDNLRRELSEESKSLRTLRLGMIDSIADQLFSETQIDFGAQTAITVDNSTRLIRAIELDRLDIAFTTKPLVALDKKFMVKSLGSEPFLLVASPKLVGEVAKSVKDKKFIHNLISYNQSASTFQRLESQLRAKDLSFSVGFFSTSPDLMRLMALSSKGPVILPLAKISADLKSKRLVAIKGMEFSRPISAITLEGKYINQSMKQLMAEVENKLSPPSRKSGDIKHYA